MQRFLLKFLQKLIDFGVKSKSDANPNDKLGKSLIDENRRKRLELIEQKIASADITQMAQVFAELKSLVAVKNDWTLSEILRDEISILDEIAKENQRAKPIVKIADRGVTFSEEQRTLLRSIFIHLGRNSVVHGIESKSERKAKQKPTAGTIAIEVIADAHAAVIRMSDDGRGLNLKKLAEIGQAQGVLKADASDEEIAEIIFKKVLSRTQDLTKTSGNDIGMDAVRAFLLDAKGNIQIHFTGARSEHGFRPFEFVITLAKETLKIAA